jgi:hypothetical protein
MTPQKISIITPSYGQLDWLRLCVASVADQNAPEEQDAPAAQKIATKPHGSGAVDERSEPWRGGTVRREEDAIKWKIGGSHLKGEEDMELKVGGSSLGGDASAEQIAESKVDSRTSRAALETQSPISCSIAPGDRAQHPGRRYSL